MKRIAWLAAAVVALGCASAPFQSRHAEEPGLAIALGNRVAEPCTLERARVSVDGTALAVGVTPANGDPAPVGFVPLQQGAHALSVLASVRCPATADAPDGVVTTLHAQQAFRTTAPSPRLGIDLFLGGDRRRLEARIALDGGALQGDGATADASDAIVNPRCDFQAPARRAACLAAIQLEGARKARDVVKVVCINDKLVQMRPLLAIADEDGVARSQQARDAQSRVLALSHEVADCVGEDALASD